MSAKIVRIAYLAGGFVLCTAACGGGAGTGGGARSPDGVDGEGGDNGVAGTGTSQAVESMCGDESCFTCGEGFCLAGFYCDEQAQGGPACSWLPSCPDSPSCGCIEQTLGDGCNCREESGGVFVSCN